MSNKITEKFFTQDDFSKREQEVLTQVTKETGFQVEREIFRGAPPLGGEEVWFLFFSTGSLSCMLTLLYH